MLGYKKWVLNSPAYVTGGSTKVLLQDLPDARLLGFLLRVKFDLTTTIAATLAGTQLYRILDLLKLGDRVRATGRGLWFLRWCMSGATPQMPASIPAVAAVYSRFCDFWVPFADFASASPLDTAINTSLVRNTAIEINWGNEAALFAAVGGSLSAVGVRTIAVLDKPKPEEIAAEPEIDFTDWNQQTANVPAAGAISHLFAYDETTDDMLDTDYTTWTIFVDGETLVPIEQTGELVAEYNLLRANGVSPITPSATVPIGGEQIVDEPGVAAAAGQAMTIPFIPLIVPPADAAGYSLTHLPIAQSMLRVDFTGAHTAVRLMQRRIRLGDKSRAVDTLRSTRTPDPGSRAFVPKVNGFGRLSKLAASILPKQVNLSPEEIRERGGFA